jgi:hypothetical protein
MKQTAIEWLADNLHYLHSTKWNDMVEQAKEIEKHYIKDAFIIGINNGMHGYKTSEEYYKKTYKK